MMIVPEKAFISWHVCFSAKPAAAAAAAACDCPEMELSVHLLAIFSSYGFCDIMSCMSAETGLDLSHLSRLPGHAGSCCNVFEACKVNQLSALLQGVTQEELLVEAQTSLIGAAEKFDVSKKARLTSYAWFDIMRCLQRLCQTEGALLPMARSALHDLYRLDKAEKALSQQNASEPTLSEVAAKVCTPGSCTVNIPYFTSILLDHFLTMSRQLDKIGFLLPNCARTPAIQL